MKKCLLSVLLSPFALMHLTAADGELQIKQEDVADHSAQDGDKDKSNYGLVKKIVTAGVNNNSKGKVVRTKEVLDICLRALKFTHEHSNDLRKKRYDVMKTFGTQTLASRAFFPDVSVNYVYGIDATARKNSTWDKDGKLVPPTQSSEGSEYSKSPSFGVQLKQNIFNGGGTIAALRSARIEGKAALCSYKAIEGDEYEKIVRLILNIITNKLLLEYHKVCVDVYQEILKVAMNKLSVGEIDRSEVAFAEATLAGNDAALAQIKIKLAQLEGDLERFTGLKLTDIPLVFPDLTQFLPKNVSEMEELARKGNYKILTSYFASLANKMSVKVARAALAPTVDLTVGASLQDRRLSQYYLRDEDGRVKDFSEYKNSETSNDSTSLSLALNVRLPIDTQGVASNKSCNARFDYVRSKIDEQKISNDVLSEVATLFIQLRCAQESVAAFKRQVKANKIQVQASLQELAAGAKVYAQVLKGHSFVLESQCKYVGAQLSVAELSVRLLLLIGRLDIQTFGGENVNFNESYKDVLDNDDENNCDVVATKRAEVVQTATKKIYPVKVQMQPIL